MDHQAPKQISKRRMLLLAGLLMLVVTLWMAKGVITGTNWNPNREIGMRTDSLEGVYTYYNGGVGQSHGRNTSPEGYNIGIKYQCVEFVKRYFLEVYHHKMPDAYGHAKDFFDPALQDGQFNQKRGLLQFSNGSRLAPQKGDLLVWGRSLWNAYGHVAIVAEVNAQEIIVVQQNPGPYGDSRISIPLSTQDKRYHLASSRLLGWLRMP